jgi:hypothetical protein
MMKRILLMVVAAAAISAPAMITPAAAQSANLNLNIGIPGAPMPYLGVAPQPTYYAWGNPGYYRRWDDRRAWEREHVRHEEWRDHHYYR